MATRGFPAYVSAMRFLASLSLLTCAGGCGSVNEGGLRLWDLPVQERGTLARTEQMIDDLDRTMTANGTIGVKSPDVWGQDRLAKFRSEYETQMSDWLKTSFKGEVNAAVRRTEADSRRLHLGTSITEISAKAEPPKVDPNSASALARSLGASETAALNSAPPADKTPVVLEPTVVLDEHSNYLNHLNQLRRINAGDDLTDRPGYSLYLVRIPVTLSPGPKSRYGKGAIITVSAKSLMTRDTLRNVLRNAVINETVNNLTQVLSNQPCEGGEPVSGAGSFSLVSVADTEVFYGARNIAWLREEAECQLARDLAAEPHHRAARISEWLREELEASYHLLEEAAAPKRSGQKLAAVDPLEAIGGMVVRRDYEQLASLQSQSIRDNQVLRAGGQHHSTTRDELANQRRRTLDLLGFALRIHAAAVNRRLKQDMIDQDPSLRQRNLENTSFFDPEAPPEVVAIFERYVNTKWPLRVYAIEPVIAQQNVADAFGRRLQSGFEVGASAPLASLKVISGLASAGLAGERRSVEEETAIRLNPTMVGFGAGESTFGWVFYPRLQTRTRDGRLMTDIALLLNGRWPGPTGKEQSIEPGQRECTALIVMPNFVPKIEFITVANWFRTNAVGDGQKSELEKSSTLARKVSAVENALNRAKVEEHYLPEEYQIALERLKQIKSMMPTQRLQVSVPYTADNNDSRIFCSQGGQLRPSLLAWHGRPPERGQESTILIEGNNFSIHDTHVIAGGKPARSELVSRNVLEVTISREAASTPSAAGKPLLDINVATPNGVSNHLLIEMQPERTGRDQPATEAKTNQIQQAAATPAAVKAAQPANVDAKVSRADAQTVTSGPGSKPGVSKQK